MTIRPFTGDRHRQLGLLSQWVHDKNLHAIADRMPPRCGTETAVNLSRPLLSGDPWKNVSDPQPGAGQPLTFEDPTPAEPCEGASWGGVRQNGGDSSRENTGLGHFARTHSGLGVVQDGQTRRIEYRENGQLTAGPEIAGDQLWLKKSTWGLEGCSRYTYSADGIRFTEFGPEYQLSWGTYRGDRIGIHSFNPKQDGGYVDVEFFTCDYSGPSDRIPTIRRAP